MPTASSTLRSTLGRKTKGEVVLTERLRAALGKFNPTLPPEAIHNAIDELTRDLLSGQISVDSSAR